MKSNAETPDSSNVADTLKWIVAVVLLAAAVVGNALLGGGEEFTIYELNVVFRAIAAVVLVGSALAVIAITGKGKAAITFANEAKVEVRKVVWPTRQETMQTTLIVLAVSIIMALALWGIDGIMIVLVNLATGV